MPFEVADSHPVRGDRQRSSGHLAVLAWSTARVGGAAQASWERLTEITSGRTSCQQGLVATCKDLGR